ncbi:MAG TPA: hypothetical protein VE054_03945 [Blattabacteriaceae bacterium]|nr:hypothetical protein [Blattabacteriaceae bacterium]
MGRVKPAEAGNGPVGVEWQHHLRQGSDPLPMSLSQKPHPLALLLKTKVKPQFERTVKSLSMPFFSVFLGANPAQLRLSFSFYCSVGRGLQSFPITVWYPALASGQQLGASSFFLSKNSRFARKEHRLISVVFYSLLSSSLRMEAGWKWVG